MISYLLNSCDQRSIASDDIESCSVKSVDTSIVFFSKFLLLAVWQGPALHLDVLINFKKEVNKEISSKGLSVKLFEIIHNHVLVDTLSEKDIEFAQLFSVDFPGPTQIVALVEHDNKFVAVKSSIYKKGEILEQN